MSSTGNVFPGTGENNAGIGATAWTNPGNVVSDNATDATCAAGASSQYLIARNFGFTVPSIATINGITVRVEASEHSGGTESLNARLQDDSAALIGSSKANTISGTGKSVYTYGGTADVWGATLTPTILNDADFGVRLWFTTAHDVRVDFVTLAVEYTVAYSLVIDSATYAITNNDVGVLIGWLSSIDQATYSITANDITLVYDSGGYDLPIEFASYSITTNDIGLLNNRLIPVDQAQFDITNQDVSLLNSKVIPVDTASFSLTTNDLGVLNNRLLQVSQTQFDITNQDILFSTTKAIVLDSQIFSLSTNPITLSYSGETEEEIIGCFRPPFKGTSEYCIEESSKTDNYGYRRRRGRS